MKCDTCLKTLTVSTYYCPNCGARLNQEIKETSNFNPKHPFKISSIEEFEQFQIEKKRQEFKNSKTLFVYSFFMNLGFWFLVYILFELELYSKFPEEFISKIIGFITLIFIISVFNVVYRYIRLLFSKG